MKEATKNDIKDVAKIIVGFGTWILLVYIIPQGSLAQNILAGLVSLALLVAIVWFTPIGNPIKRWLRKRKAEKAAKEQEK